MQSTVTIDSIAIGTSYSRLGSHLDVETLGTIPSTLRSRPIDDEADTQSQFDGGKSEFSFTELLLPQEATPGLTISISCK